MTQATLIKKAAARLQQTDWPTMSKRELHDTIQNILADLMPAVKDTTKTKSKAA